MPDKEASYKHSEKKMPSEVEVLSVMKEIQEQIYERRFERRRRSSALPS
jgi:hypothetical protein